MAPNRPKKFTRLLWEDIMPVGSFNGLLAWTQSVLKDSHRFPPIETLYISVAIWFIAFLVSLRYLPKGGPFSTASIGWVQNLLMLWDLYKRANGTEASLRLADVVYAGIFTILAVGTSCYILANRVRMDFSPALPAEDESREAEKA